jgi:hypothetical protein
MDYYECKDGQVVYCPEEDGREDTAHANSVHKIYQLIRAGEFHSYIMLVQLDQQGLEDFGLLSAATRAFPGLVTEAQRQLASWEQEEATASSGM